MIRVFFDSDADICRKIIKDCFEKSVIMEEEMKQLIKEKLTGEGWLERKAKTKSFFVYETNGKIVGLGCLAENVIDKLYVAPEMQGKGIGSEIMCYLELLAEVSGFKKTILYALPSSKEFYNKKGYEEKEIHYYDYPNNIKIPTITMVKNIE